jgi:hypothetical protein
MRTGRGGWPGPVSIPNGEETGLTASWSSPLGRERQRFTVHGEGCLLPAVSTIHYSTTPFLPPWPFFKTVAGDFVSLYSGLVNMSQPAR